MKIGSVPRSDILRRPSRNPAKVEAPATAPEPASSPRIVRPFSSRARYAFGISLLVAAVLFLFAVSSVVRPFIWAGIVCYVLSPVVGFAKRSLRLGHGT